MEAWRIFAPALVASQGDHSGTDDVHCPAELGIINYIDITMAMPPDLYSNSACNLYLEENENECPHFYSIAYICINVRTAMILGDLCPA